MLLVERIQSLCSSKDTTLIGIEREIGLGRGTIRNWDKNSPSVDKLQKVADYFKVSTDYLLYGFDRVQLAHLINTVKNGRSVEQFSEDTGIGIDELIAICTATKFDPPSLETIEKITTGNPVDYLVDRSSLLQAAGYRTIAGIEEDFKDTSFEEKYTPATIAAHHDGDEWTEEELTDIERFKEFVRSKRNAKS